MLFVTCDERNAVVVIKNNSLVIWVLCLKKPTFVDQTGYETSWVDDDDDDDDDDVNSTLNMAQNFCIQLLT